MRGNCLWPLHRWRYRCFCHVLHTLRWAGHCEGHSILIKDLQTCQTVRKGIQASGNPSQRKEEENTRFTQYFQEDPWCKDTGVQQQLPILLLLDSNHLVVFDCCWFRLLPTEATQQIEQTSLCVVLLVAGCHLRNHDVSIVGFYRPSTYHAGTFQPSLGGGGRGINGNEDD